jgi:hypothetical protein
MKVIFLDVDGVMISEESFLLTMALGGRVVIFSRKAMKALRAIVKRTGAVVVLTSSWRPMPGYAPTRSYEQFCSALQRNGTPLYDRTPWLEDREHDRSDEICAWLEEHPAESFVLIDDNDRFRNHPELKERWIPIDAEHGLNKTHVERAVELLNLPLCRRICSQA